MNNILLGDCLELLPTIADKSVDMILCDLPYGTTNCEWDSIIDMGRLWQEYERVIKDNGAIVLTANAVFTFQLWESNKKLFRYKMIWKKSTLLGFLNANKMPLRNYEDILIFYKALPTYNPQKKMGHSIFKKKDVKKNPIYGKTDINFSNENIDGSRFPTDIIEIDNPNHNSIHPTQKPVALFEYLIKTYTNENDLVLDNCSGSGTTAIACINTSRRYICMERDEGYYQKSVERVANHEPLLQLLNQK
jgi:site-specific DNA-methyltransferase (adenine-specific)